MSKLSNQKADVRGLLGRKLGMTQTWDDDNRIVPVTVIEAGT
ncbi:MAG: 50S ribosomal protein L3, partial [Actinomycetia bacterium]|nr:50S ribosomal protein L3 [Actinomycetes bacterium]